VDIFTKALGAKPNSANSCLLAETLL